MEDSVETAPADSEILAARRLVGDQNLPDSNLLSVRLLGALHVTRGTDPVPLPASRKARGLLAYLLMSPRPLHRTRVCEVFWDLPNDPRGELRWCLSKLRAVVDDAETKRVQAGKDLVAIDATTLRVDALQVALGADAAIAGTDVEALERLAASFDGVFLEGVMGDRTPPFEAWLAGQRERFRSIETRLLSRLCALLPPASERHFHHLRRLVDLAPDDLARHRDLMAALADAGRLAEAKAHLGLAQRSLKDHGIDPAPLAAVLRTARSEAKVTPQPPPPSENVVREPPQRPRSSIRRKEAVPPQIVSSVTEVARRPAVNNLPTALSTYVSRSREEAEIRSRLGEHRVVTLVGAGGTGKTRLALETGRTLLDGPLDGVWILELSGLTDPLLVGEALCSCIGAAMIESRSATDGAAHYLQDKRAVVILDNCEHLIEVVTDVMLTLLRLCPGLGVLATSRERLGVPGESLYQVPGLSLPPATTQVDASSARGHDAVRLFEERAMAVVQNFALSDANVEAIVSICRILDGFPMAIELVIPQLRMIAPQGLLSKLKDRVLFVTKGVRGAVERHRTLQALFDWSYNLLQENEKALFRRLAVFTGGWTLEAAAFVTADEAVAGDDVFDLLSRLVETSLVVTDLSGPVPRYAFLETTRQYALDKLAESGDPDGRDRLLIAMTDLFAAADATWRTTPTALWLAGVTPDLDNLRSSLDWAFRPGGNTAGGVALCAYAMRVWDELALLSERERRVATAFTHNDGVTPALISARLYLGRLSNSAHGDRANFDLAWRSAELFRDAGDISGTGEALARAGAALATPGSTGEAILHLEEGLRLLKPFGSSKPLVSGLRSLAVARYFDHDFDDARTLLNQSRRAAQDVGDLRGIANVQIGAAELAFAAGDPEEAIAQTEAMLSSGHANSRQIVLGLTNLVAYLLAVDRLSDARQRAREGLIEARALDWRGATVRLIEHLALVSALAGDLETAAIMLGHSVEFYAGGAGSREFTELASFDRLTALLESDLPAKPKRTLLEEGAAWSSDRAYLQAQAVAAGPQEALPGSA